MSFAARYQSYQVKHDRGSSRKRCLSYSIIAFVTLALVLLVQVPAGAAAPDWTPQTSPDWNLFGVSAASTTKVWAVGSNGLIGATTDGGTNWAAQTSGSSEDLYDVCAADTSNVFAVGGHTDFNQYPFMFTSYGQILNTTNGGTTWVITNKNAELHGVSATSPVNAWAVGRDSSLLPGNPAVVLHTSDGTNWNPQNPVVSEYLNGVAAVDENNAWVVGDHGTIIHTSNGGSSWQQQTSGTGQNLYGVTAVSIDEAWACGSNGVILHTTNGGATWVAQTSTVSRELYRITAANQRDVWAVGYLDTCAHTTDGGATWTSLTGDIQYYNSVCSFETGDAWAVGATLGAGTDILRWVPGLHIASLSSPTAFPGETITIIGTDFGTDPGTHSSDYVRFGASVPAESDYVSWNNNYIQVKVPAGFTGSADVYVRSAGLDSNALPFAVPPPAVTSIDPVNGNRGATLTGALVNGNYFLPGAIVQLKNGASTIDATNVSVTTTRITCDIAIPSGATIGFWDVYVQNTDGQNGTKMGAFDVQYPPPVLTSMTPDNGLRGQTINATAAGSDVRGPSTNLLVELRKTGETSIPLTITGPFAFTFTVPADAAYGAWNLYLEHLDDHKSCTLASAFTVHGFTLTPAAGPGGSISPSTPQTVDYGGSKTFSFNANAGYKIADVKADEVSVGKPASYAFNNVTADHTLAVTFSQLVTKPPAVTSITPTRGPIGTTVTLKGTDFGTRLTSGLGVAYAVSPSYVMFNQTQATDYVSWANTEIKVKVPAGAVPGPVTVTTAAGTSNANKTFTPTYALTPFYFLAEGSTAYGFSTSINIANPTGEDLNCTVNFLLTNGSVKTAAVGLPKNSQTSVNPESYVGKADFSTRVDCVQGKMIAVDRTMVWTGQGASAPEAHSSIGTTSPQRTWYLAEGSAAWGFETWTLVANPNNRSTNITISYMLESGAVIERSKTLAANSRASFSMKDAIGAQDASILVTSDLPVVTERSMYRNDKREGSCSIGTPSPGSNFFLAEGTTAWGFTTYVLIQNPNPNPAGITLTYMTPAGPKVQPSFTMPASSRKTVKVNDALPNSDFSIQVASDRPVIAERAMYWDSPAGEACHASSGVCSSHMNFYLPDGSTQNGAQTYTLVVNPNSTAVQVEVSYLKKGGDTPITFTDTVNANSRKTYSMSDKLPDGAASIVVKSKTAGKGIMAERSMYWNSRSAGTDTLGGFSD